jgi:hypothetical protein
MSCYHASDYKAQRWQTDKIKALGKGSPHELFKTRTVMFSESKKTEERVHSRGIISSNKTALASALPIAAVPISRSGSFGHPPLRRSIASR